jgi:outer membrane protein assembly factor BamB
MFDVKQTNKTLSIALILILTVSALMACISVANAHTPAWTIPTTAYVTPTPNVIGIGQSTTIVAWLDRYSPTAGGGVGQRWDGFLITITKPDGNKFTIGPWQCRSDLAIDWQVYTPDMVGKYTIVFSWPGETCVASEADFTNAAIGDNFLGATSNPATLTVQQTPLPSWQEPPLPTGYWTMPINAMNRGWSTLVSNWLTPSSMPGTANAWLPRGIQEGTGPGSAHVLWTTPLTPGRAGGILEAQWPGISINSEDYESPAGAPIIMNGKIYYSQPQVSDSCKYGYYCLDLFTGQQIWYKNGTDNGLNGLFTTAGGYTLSQSFPTLTQGQIYQYHSINGNGLLSYLIMVSGSTWYFLDAATGNWMLALKNVPSGTAAIDQDGSILRYSYNTNTGNLLCWNSSQSIPPLGPIGTNQQQWRMRMGATIDAVNDTSWTVVGPSGINTNDTIQPRSGYTMNITIQKGLPGSISILEDDNRVPKEIVGIYKPTQSMYGLGPTLDGDAFTVWTLRIDEHVAPCSPYPNLTFTQNNNLGFGATLLLNKNIPVPLPGKNYTWTIGSPNYDNQIFTVRCSQTGQVWVYSLGDGSLLWGPTPQFGPMSYYGASASAYYDKLVVCNTMDGTMAAFDIKTGKELWTYNATAPGFESPYGANMPLSIWIVCDGKIYTYSTEHSPSKPLWRASYIRCINITDGAELWKLPYYHQFIAAEALADGYVVGCSDYDNLIYCIGIGPSATSVSASPSVTSLGSTVIITGKVTDVSPGTKNPTQQALFPNGVPAVSDSSQDDFMSYVYEQQAMPTNATGVPVTLTALDSNGNTEQVGTATSDASGFYSFVWTPPITGKYTITASFAGSKSYGGSSAETAIDITNAPAPAVTTPAQTPAPSQAPTATIAPTSNPTQTIAPTPSPIIVPPSSGTATTTYIAIGLAIIVIIAAAAALILRRRK